VTSTTKWQPRIALASGSPRRASILRALGVPFSAFATAADETLIAGEEGVVAAERLARVKAAAGAKDESLPVLAADTIVVRQGEIYGKPESAEDARRMLDELQGHTHEVITGVCIQWGEVIRSGVERTAVRLAKMRPEERDWYVKTGEPLDKAGAYNIEGLGAMFIAEVRGSPSNVAGLPVGLLRSLVREAGVDLGWPER
jgi:septum formation protein